MAENTAHPVGGIDYPRTLMEFDDWFASEACPSHLSRLRQKPWKFASRPDTLSADIRSSKSPAGFRVLFAGRAALHTELLALRQQVAVLKRKRSRSWLRVSDRIFASYLVVPMAGRAPLPGNRQARDRQRLAPQGVQAFLDMAVAAAEAKENAVKQDCVQATSAIKSP